MSHVRRYLTVVAIMIVLSLLARWLWGISVGESLLVLLIGWPLFGTLITIDDDLPGGWSNPDGTATPEWKTLWWWSDLLLVRGSVVTSSLMIEEALTSNTTSIHWFVPLLMMAVGLPVFISGARKEISNAG